MIKIVSILFISATLSSLISLSESSICKSSDEFMVSPYCYKYFNNKSINLQSELWPVIGITTFSIDQAVKKTLFLPERCREAMTPFVCASGYNECLDNDKSIKSTKSIDSSEPVVRSPCRSICENVHLKCGDYFEENNIDLPDCFAINNETGLEVYPKIGHKIESGDFVPCFDVDLSIPAPEFPYNCPFPFITTNDGCQFQCPAPVTDDKDLQKTFENFYLWSRRTTYITIYVLGLIFLILQFSTYQTWFSFEKIFPINLHCYILISSVWNLIGMESSSFPVCHSETESANKKDAGCVAQAFFISTFAGIACMYFFMTLKVMVEVGFGGLRRRKLSKELIYFGVFLGFACQFFPAILIVATGSYEVLALACITDYETTLWGMHHFTFWLINGPATLFVFLGFLFSLVTVYKVIKTTITTMIQMNQFNFQSFWNIIKSPTSKYDKRRRLIVFIIVFGVIIVLAHISTLTGVNSKEYGEGAQEWVICVITNFINSKSFDTRNIEQPHCEWDPKPNIFLVAYGVFSPTLFEFVYIIILWTALNKSLHDKYGSSISEVFTNTASTVSTTSKKLSTTLSFKSETE